MNSVFPGRFRSLAQAFGTQRENTVLFLAESGQKTTIPGVRRLRLAPPSSCDSDDPAEREIVTRLRRGARAGNALLSKSLMLIASLGDHRLVHTLAEAVYNTSEGEIAELANLRNLDLSYEEYLAIITGKTAWMLRASCELAALTRTVFGITSNTPCIRKIQGRTNNRKVT